MAGAVELAVADPAEPAGRNQRPHRQWGGAAVAGVGVFGPEPSDVRGLPDDLGCGQGPASHDEQQGRGQRADERSDLGLEGVDLGGELLAASAQSRGEAGDGPDAAGQVPAELADGLLPVGRPGWKVPSPVELVEVPAAG